MLTTMDYLETMQALKRLRVETGSLACLGCGHEHNCSTQGCAILRNAVAHMEAALDRATLTPPNEPLTLEELRQMNGEPVYVVEELSNGARFESWVLIGTQKWGYVGLYNQLWQSDYETQARCRNTKYYRRPPEVEK